MKINKSFVEALSHKKISTVGGLVKEMEIFEFKDNTIQNIQENYTRLEEIFYTVWFLEDNDLIELSKSAVNTRVSISLNGIKSDDYVYERFKYLQKQIDNIWGKRIEILPGFYEFIANDYLTKESRIEWIKFRLALVVAVVAAMFTGLFTKLFDLYLTDTIKLFL